MNAQDAQAGRLLRSALAAAARGWHVFPVAPGAKVPALRGDWRDLATTEPARICSWWARRAYNIGISCGPSGLVVIDLDLPHAGEPAHASGAQTLASLCRERGDPYPCGTFTVRTPSGGTHLYFTAAGAAVPNSAGTLGRHIDIRAAGGYVIAPGSRIAGRAYHAQDANAQPSVLPGWIATALAGHRAEPRTLLPAACMPHAEPDRRAVAYVMAALHGEALRVAGAREGTRNDTLNRAAFALGQLVASGLLPELPVVAALADAAAQAGLPEREARRTIRSGMTAGSRRPRSSPSREQARAAPGLRRPQALAGGPAPPMPRP